jgi:hypothetical protein
MSSGEEMTSVSQPTVWEVWELRQVNTVDRLTGRATEMGLHGLKRTALFLPLGIFIALALPRREHWFARFLLVLAPAAIGAMLVAWLVVGFEDAAPWEPPGVLDAALPVVGCLLGAWVGVSLTRGIVPLLMVIPKLALLVALLGAAGAAAAYLAASEEPLDLEPVSVSAAERRELSQRLRGGDPTKLGLGETRELHLSPRELDALLAWGLSATAGGGRGRLETRPDELRLQASARIPRVDRFLNLDARLKGRVDHGRLDLGIEELKLGRLDVPAILLGPISGFARTAVSTDRTFAPVLEGIESLSFDDGGLRLQHGPMDLRGEVLPNLLARLGPSEAVLESARAHLKHLAGKTPDLAREEDRFGSLTEAAFALASRRSETSDPVVENSGAILALATIVGHARLRVFAGLDAEEAAIDQIRNTLAPVTLRGRGDWAQHFYLSAGLTQLSSIAVADAVGVFKEELDSDTEGGGSGFSFADLLADRAGTLFASEATRSPERARAMQERLESGFDVDDFFPVADGLAEGIPDEVLEAHYGGVGGAEYRRVVETIERRLASCAAYR